MLRIAREQASRLQLLLHVAGYIFLNLKNKFR